MAEAHRPVILISTMTPDSPSATAIMAMVRATGAEPMLISKHAERLAGKDNHAIALQVKADLAKADGVIVMGNNSDIDPGDYGAKEKHKETHSERATPEGEARAKYEYALLAAALEKKTPLLGVCAGMQRLNVLLGGSLNQHVPDLIGSNEHDQTQSHVAPYIPVEFVQIGQGTLLSAIADGIPGVYTPTSEKLPPGVVMENSMHHQSIDKVGGGLRISAASGEPHRPHVHVSEAIEADPTGPFGHQFVLGVQWHPEFGASDLSVRLLGQLARQALEYGKIKSALAPMEETVRSQGEATLAGAEAGPLIGSWAQRLRQQQAIAAATNTR